MPPFSISNTKPLCGFCLGRSLKLATGFCCFPPVQGFSRSRTPVCRGVLVSKACTSVFFSVTPPPPFPSESLILPLSFSRTPPSPGRTSDCQIYSRCSAPPRSSRPPARCLTTGLPSGPHFPLVFPPRPAVNLGSVRGRLLPTSLL